MNTNEFERPTEDPEPAPGTTAGGGPDLDDVEGHSLLVDPESARLLQRAREDDLRRQAEKHRREQEAKHPLQPRGRR